jgi:hypothetical protein
MEGHDIVVEAPHEPSVLKSERDCQRLKTEHPLTDGKLAFEDALLGTEQCREQGGLHAPRLQREPQFFLRVQYLLCQVQADGITALEVDADRGDSAGFGSHSRNAFVLTVTDAACVAARPQGCSIIACRDGDRRLPKLGQSTAGAGTASGKFAPPARVGPFQTGTFCIEQRL